MIGPSDKTRSFFSIYVGTYHALRFRLIDSPRGRRRGIDRFVSIPAYRSPPLLRLSIITALSKRRSARVESDCVSCSAKSAADTLEKSLLQPRE